ncbi:ABC transporter ATP-binding protein [Nocardiopsis sp. B62]|uniref:ABC transporter ATP-binding protein n=1 Tax=Nocardiopsis sp. B62 TaxID=2824874 RepID=UPI001B372778|nr:ABC transporter ATP-binding protein [Nocardiopsis sp. B62]MBQ1080258.1 ABC transporter ATP-binding protein [Nocardiopsis sp. B62]
MTRSTRVNLRTMGRHLRHHRVALLGVAALSLLVSGATLAQPVLVRNVLDTVSGEGPVGASVVALVVMVALVAALTAVRGYFLERLSEHFVLRLRQRLTNHMLRLPVRDYDQRSSADMLSRVTTDTIVVRSIIGAGFVELLSASVIIVGAGVAMSMTDGFLFTVTFACLGTGLTVTVLGARRLRPLTERTQQRLGRLATAVERALTGVRTVRALRAEADETRRIGHRAEEVYRAGLRVAFWRAIVAPASNVTVQGTFLLILAVGGTRVAEGAMTVGELISFTLFLFFMMMPLGQVFNAYVQLQAGMGALQRVEDVLGLPLEETDDAHRATPPPQPRSRLDSPPPSIAFDRVTFGYDRDPVLRDVSFVVAPGSRTAVVGPSGAGKSTLLALIERFYDPTSGSVRVDGTDVRARARDDLRSGLGYVQQEAPVLSGSIRDNLLLAAPEAGDERLLEVLDRVDLTGVVHRSPQGLDTPVGQDGVLLSGGERQRLAIARTLLDAPPVLLLDEPTSNLDARSEAALREVMDDVARRRTLLVVAHRLSTVTDADQIVVLDRGAVVAVGSHEELLTSSPLYRELATHQLLAG